MLKKCFYIFILLCLHAPLHAQNLETDSLLKQLKYAKEDLNKGDAYRNLNDLKSALLYCDTAGMYAAQTNNIDRQARIYDIISDLYSSQKQYATSIAFQNKALELYKKYNNTVMIGQSYDD